MTPRELRRIRIALGLSQTQMGRVLGFDGKADSARRTVGRYESGENEIPGYIARLAEMYNRHGIPEEWA